MKIYNYLLSQLESLLLVPGYNRSCLWYPGLHDRGRQAILLYLIILLSKIYQITFQKDYDKAYIFMKKVPYVTSAKKV